MTEPEDPIQPADDDGQALEAELIEEALETDEADEAAEPAEASPSDAMPAEFPLPPAIPDPPQPVAEAVTGTRRPPPARDLRPDLIDRREPLYRECRGYRLRLDPPDLARLRELPGSRGRSDDEIGEAFFDGQADRLASAIADDVPTPSEIRVVVDPYSRQAFLALENRIRGILSF